MAAEYKEKLMKHVKETCRFYRGHIPCRLHKQSRALCDSCDHFEGLKERIFIIKLGAIGDVIRTTPLLRKIKETHPHAEITWLTYSPEVLPVDWVDNRLDFSLQNILWLETQRFDWLINLDKDKEAIALAEKVHATKKSGFKMNAYGKCVPIGTDAEKHKWMTGLRDDLNKSNTLNYMEEIFAICGFLFAGEEYILPLPKELRPRRCNTDIILVGLNTGCGARWPTRLWPESHWHDLAVALKEKGYKPVFLGGPQEEEKNMRLSALTGAEYLRTPSLDAFIKTVDGCDIIVSQVTMAMHVAIALKKHLVLMNNIFNRNEFHLYGRGVILEPQTPCRGCFKQNYDDRCVSKCCMDMISVSQVLDAVLCHKPLMTEIYAK